MFRFKSQKATRTYVYIYSVAESLGRRVDTGVRIYTHRGNNLYGVAIQPPKKAYKEKRAAPPAHTHSARRVDVVHAHEEEEEDDGVDDHPVVLHVAEDADVGLQRLDLVELLDVVLDGLVTVQERLARFLVRAVRQPLEPRATRMVFHFFQVIIGPWDEFVVGIIISTRFYLEISTTLDWRNR